MAILKDLEVSIVVNDKPLTEYENDEEQLPNTSTIYIAAVSGAFQVEISCKKTLAQYGGTSLRFALELDGEEIDSVIMCKESKKVHMKGVQKCANGQCTMERYSFSDIDIIEHSSDADTPDLQHIVSKIGVIAIKVQRTKNARLSSKSTNRHSSAGSKLDVQPLSEKLLKGGSLSMRTSLRARETIGSITALQDMCIIPRSPNPVSVGERPVEELTREELIELIKSSHLSIKPEPISQISSGAGVKRERDEEYEEIRASAKSKKLRVNREIEVTNLLDD
ncbi:hypothetical protein MMC14_010395 [Varicellaria rhodocarpa]|nr:hypothetical protein [Varicellaria rhodocarpa]